jgi:hypothetical protein
MTCVFFVRRHEILRLEVHANEATGEFALILKERDGRIRQNDFADATDLQRGWKQMENQLAERIGFAPACRLSFPIASRANSLRTSR